MDLLVKLFGEGCPVAVDGGGALRGGGREVDVLQRGVGLHHLVEAGEDAGCRVGCFHAEVFGRLGEAGDAFEFDGGVLFLAELFEDVGGVERGPDLDERLGLGGRGDGEKLFAGFCQIVRAVFADELAREAQAREIGGLVVRMLRDGRFEFGDAAGVGEFAAGGKLGALDRALDDDADGDEHGECADADDGFLPVHSHPHFELVQHGGNGGLLLCGRRALVLLGLGKLFEGLDFFLVFVCHDAIYPEKVLAFLIDSYNIAHPAHKINSKNTEGECFFGF